MNETVLLAGVPGGQRTEACRQSLSAAGHRADVLDLRRVFDGTAVLPALPAGTLVRVESPSDDPNLDRALIRAGGGADADLTRGALPDTGAWVRGLGTLLHRLSALLDGTGWRRLFDVPATLTMFDKSATHRRLRAAGVPVAPTLTLPGPATRDQVRAAAEQAGWRQVFVKARYGSSGAGVLALRWSRQRWAGYTTVGLSPGRGPVNVGVHRIDDPHRIDEVIRAVDARGGVHLERWLPKFGFDGGAVDVRVVVIAGTARHVLARVAAGPLTNLHLGARRGDVPALVDALGRDRWRRLLDAGEQAAACFRPAHHLGVDIGLNQAGRPFVIETNAFGDFHEGIVDADGHDTYQAEIVAAR